MKIELENNKVFLKTRVQKRNTPILVERKSNGDTFVDKITQQRLFIRLNFKII